MQVPDYRNNCDDNDEDGIKGDRDLRDGQNGDDGHHVNDEENSGRCRST